MTNSPYTYNNHAAVMSKAIQLAKKGLYTCNPNPRVGCVLFNDGLVIGEGWHARAGEEHAEIMALRSARENNPNYIAGSTAYVTLEPCCHTGKTPPCVNELIDAKIKHVVIGMSDPNPLVAGKGIQALENAGIKVTQNILQDQAMSLNPGFIKRMSTNKPYVRLKMAASLDGKTALNNGTSQWITGTPARQDVQYWRARSSAVLTGVGTLIADNPSLNVRFDDADNANIKQPLRVILDSHLRTPPESKIFQYGGEVLIVTISENEEKKDKLRSDKTEVIQLPANIKGQVDLHSLMSVLAEAEMNELLIESGSELAGAFLDAAYVDEIVLYLAPQIIGAQAKSLFELPELQNMQDRIDLKIVDTRMLGNDLRINAKPIYQ